MAWVHYLPCVISALVRGNSRISLAGAVRVSKVGGGPFRIILKDLSPRSVAILFFFRNRPSSLFPLHSYLRRRLARHRHFSIAENPPTQAQVSGSPCDRCLISGHCPGPP